MVSGRDWKGKRQGGSLPNNEREHLLGQLQMASQVFALIDDPTLRNPDSSAPACFFSLAKYASAASLDQHRLSHLSELATGLADPPKAT